MRPAEGGVTFMQADMIATIFRLFRVWTAGLVLLLPAPSALAEREVQLRPDAPLRYTVASGDTLWSVAARFLEQPWQWPALWQANPAIDDPDLIYPGDHLVLEDGGAAPRLHLERGAARVVKLSPQMRRLPPREALETVDLEALEVFLAAHRVIDPQAIVDAPYVVGGDEQRLISGAGDRVFVSGALPAAGRRFALYVPGEEYRDADGELLGQALIAIGEARLERAGESLAALRLTRVTREVGAGTRVLSLDDERVATRLALRPADERLTGRIIATPDGATVIGARAVVVLDRGRRDGLAPGDVLGVQRRGERVSDPVSGRTLALPDEEAGTLLVFRCFDRVSYALVMRADTPLTIGDRVGAPTS